MAKMNRSIVFLGAGAACVVIAGMSHPKNPQPQPASDPVLAGLPPKVMAAEETLKSELMRRFTDRQNVDFGMSRVIRPGARMHFGPTMDKNAKLGVRPEYRKMENGRYEVKIDDVWVKADEQKPMMSPENDNEKEAIQALKDSKVDVALYTVGQFELDKGEVAQADPSQGTQPNPNYRDFQYGGDFTRIRAKGPAYISQKSDMAPRAYEVVDIGRKAWKGGQDNTVIKGKNGWTYFAHRVSAPDMSCAKCHGDRKLSDQGVMRDVKGAVQKANDPVGLFIIAIRQ